MLKLPLCIEVTRDDPSLPDSLWGIGYNNAYKSHSLGFRATWALKRSSLRVAMEGPVGSEKAALFSELPPTLVTVF